MKKKNTESKPVENWKPYKYRRTVEVNKDPETGEAMARDGKGRTWMIEKDEWKYYKPI